MSIAHTADTSGQPISLMADSASDLVRARTQVGHFEGDDLHRRIVPARRWDQSRILLGLNTVVVRTGRHTVLIETGIGNKRRRQAGFGRK
jgi:hypothetical protein